MSFLTQPKGGKTQQTTQSNQIPQYASAAQQNLLDLGTGALAPNIFTPQFTTAPINADMSGGYDLARQLAQSAFSSLPTPARAATPGTFDAAAYLAQNPDVAASSFASDPYSHYQRYGQAEGRAAPMTGGTPAVAAQAATNPLQTVSMQSLQDIARPGFVDPRSDPTARAAAAASTRGAQSYDAQLMRGSQVTGDAIQALLNPYKTNVIDASTAIARRNLEETLAGNRAQQAAAGSYGGSRGAVADAVLQRGFQDSTAQLTAQLMDQGWSQATATALANAQMSNQTEANNQGAINTSRAFNANAVNSANSENMAAQNRRDEFNATQGANLLDSWNKLLQQDYTNQIGARQQDNTNGVTAATTNETIRNSDFTRQMAALNSLLGVGNAQRQIYQESLDSPLKYLSALAGITPQQYSSLQTGVQPNNAASPLQTLLGAGVTLGSAALR